MARIDHADMITAEYADDARLEMRFKPFREWHQGRALEEQILDLVLAGDPARILEVGCGAGQLSALIAARTSGHVVAADQSPRMAALAASRGLDAVVTDVQSMQFPDASFDVIVASWMLYHLPDLDAGLAEIRRVLRPGGRLVAVTMGSGMLHELWSRVPDDGSTPGLSFGGDDGDRVLARHFDIVERHDMPGVTVFPSRADALDYMRATLTRAHLADVLPEWDGPLEATTTNVAFVATR